MAHLEDLIVEYYNWQDYVVKRNIKVGRLVHGGWEMEIDVVAYHPVTQHLIHLEPSLDAHSWVERELRFRKKFEAGKKYIGIEIFPWLGNKIQLEQVAIVSSKTKERVALAGGRIITIDEFIADVRKEVIAQGKASTKAISEIYPLLRTLQLSHNGYHRVVDSQKI